MYFKRKVISFGFVLTLLISVFFISFVDISSSASGIPSFKKEEIKSLVPSMTLDYFEDYKNSTVSYVNSRFGIFKAAENYIDFFISYYTDSVIRDSYFESTKNGCVKSINNLKDYGDEDSELVLELITSDECYYLAYGVSTSIGGFYYGAWTYLFGNNYYANFEISAPKMSIDEAENIFLSLIENVKNLLNKKSGVKSFSFNHYHPFPYLYTSDSLYYPGEFTAILEDVDGEGISDKNIYIFVDRDSDLDDIFYCGLKPNDPWFKTYPQYRAIGGKETDFSGSLRYNYLMRGLLDPKALADKLIENDGFVSGTVTAVAVDEDTLTFEEIKSINITFDSIAKVVDVTGDVYVRGSEYIGVTTNEGYEKVTIGHGLQPGDCLRINGSASVDIVWINGNRVIAKVPKKLIVDGGSVTVDPQKIYIMATAYDSGFWSWSDKITDWSIGTIFSGAVDAVISTIPYAEEIIETGESINEAYEFIVDKTSNVEEADLSGKLITKIRLNSRVIIESNFNYTKIYNFNGSPDILTLNNDEITINEGELANVSNAGSINLESFDNSQLNEWSEYLDEIEEMEDYILSANDTVDDDKTSQDKDSNGSPGFEFLILILAMALLLIWKRKKFQ